MISWRTTALVLALVCAVQRWQSCTRVEPTQPAERAVELRAPVPSVIETAIVPDPPAKRTLFGFRPPTWAQHLLPQPGENLKDYRDRILPLAQAAIAPQRARVARLRDQLDDHERAELDAATDEAAAAIEARVASALVNGELQTRKPMTGVTMARELLDIVDRGNAQFVSSLTADQRAKLATSRFDFADYLLFSTRWEDALTR